jgi:predicted small metal-binding protein
MSQTYEDCLELFCVCCKDVGLDCNCNTYGISDETVVYNTILHMLEYHAIKPEEMTTYMKLKILESIHVHRYNRNSIVMPLKYVYIKKL